MAGPKRPPGPGAAGGVVGPLGLQDLAEAVTMWRRDGIRLPAPLTLSDLGELDAFAREGKVDGSADPRWHGRVRQVVATLLRCAGTVDLLTTVLASVLTSELLREARRLSGLPAEAEGAELLRGLVEYAALRAPGADEPPWKASARFLAALSQVSGSDEVAARLRAWARDLGAVTEFNDALAEFARRRQEGELRLVVSLAGALTDWPEEVDAWLVGTGEPLPVHRRFACASPDRAGTGRAIGTALAWAHPAPRHRHPRPCGHRRPGPSAGPWRPESRRSGSGCSGQPRRGRPVERAHGPGRRERRDERRRRKALRSGRLHHRAGECSARRCWATTRRSTGAQHRPLRHRRRPRPPPRRPAGRPRTTAALRPIILWPRQDARPSDEGLRPGAGALAEPAPVCPRLPQPVERAARGAWPASGTYARSGTTNHGWNSADPRTTRRGRP